MVLGIISIACGSEVTIPTRMSPGEINTIAAGTQTSTAISVEQVPFITVNNDSNVRSGPSLDYPIIQTISKGTTVQAFMTSNDKGWVSLDVNNSAWISLSVVTLSVDINTLLIAPKADVPKNTPVLDIVRFDIYSIVGKTADEIKNMYGTPDDEDDVLSSPNEKNCLSRGYYHKDGYSFFVCFNDSMQVVEVVVEPTPKNADAHLKSWSTYSPYFGVILNGKQPDLIAPCAVYWDDIGGKRVAFTACSGGSDIINLIKICDATFCSVQHR